MPGPCLSPSHSANAEESGFEAEANESSQLRVSVEAEANEFSQLRGSGENSGGRGKYGSLAAAIEGAWDCGHFFGAI
jgi:hypothetical protein